MFPDLAPTQWLLAGLAAFCIGFSKSGFSGAGLVTVLVMAQIFGARDSTGALLPLLICGDILSVFVFHQHARWLLIRRMLPLTMIGVVSGYILMLWLPAALFRPIIGSIILIMAILQAIRRWKPASFEAVPHSRAFAWLMGGGSGVATMLANGAGPIMALYFLSIGTAKFQLVGTSAWFFLLVNLFKVPFSAQLGLIQPSTLAFDGVLLPAVVVGVIAGRRLIRVISANLFEALLLIFAVLASLRMIFWPNG